ncbi:MAG: hypothetical protein IMZ54_06695 [Acidobacteria bacterium]|nr:hypothetical protein [Acidobacteriota bacterium]
MLAVAGLMVGLYIITKMIDLILERTRASASGTGFIVIMATLTILATLVAMAYFVVGPDLLKMTGFK